MVAVEPVDGSDGRARPLIDGGSCGAGDFGTVSKVRLDSFRGGRVAGARETVPVFKALRTVPTSC